MKQRLFIFLILAAASLTGCTKSDVCQAEVEEVTVNYAVAAPATKASEPALGNGAAVNYVWYALYRTDGTLVNEFTLQPFFEGKALCPVTMVRDQSYKVVFVAQHYNVDGQTKTPVYAVNAESAVLSMPSSTEANSDNSDLFCYVDEVIDYKGDNDPKSIILTRKVAQINFICTAEDASAAALQGKTPDSSAITLTGVPAYYDILAGEPSTATMTVQYAKTALTGDANLLGSAFCFASDHIASAALKLYKGNDLTASVSVDHVPVEMNKRTNIVGALMTNGAASNQITQTAY